jgi:hypothetical protein
LKTDKLDSSDTSDDEDEDSPASVVGDEHEHEHEDTLHVPKSSANKATTVVTDVIKNKGQYGRFAQRWFSKGGWKSDGQRKQGMSTNDDDLPLTADGQKTQSDEHVPLTNEQKKQAEDSLPGHAKHEAHDTDSESTLTNLIPRILKTTTLYFTSRSFYFSYDYDISRSLSRQEATSPSVPLHKRFDPLVRIANITVLVIIH